MRVIIIKLIMKDKKESGSIKLTGTHRSAAKSVEGAQGNLLKKL